MGTNYYWHADPPCPCCNREWESRHIGKASGGWCFGLHVYPDEGINDLKDWEKLWKKPGSIIKDEYGAVCTPKEMKKVVTRRKWTGRNLPKNAQWFQQNSAQLGPNNLTRARIDARHCIGHGKGTWDLIVGEFS